MAEDGLEADETCTLGIGIIERDGGRGGVGPLPGVCARSIDTVRVGENARCIRDVVGLLSSQSCGSVDIERKCIAGTGM